MLLAVCSASGVGGGCLGGVGHVVYGCCNGCASVCVWGGGVSRMVGVFWSVCCG